jgi:hypothetical protein
MCIYLENISNQRSKFNHEHGLLGAFMRRISVIREASSTMNTVSGQVYVLGKQGISAYRHLLGSIIHY